MLSENQAQHQTGSSFCFLVTVDVEDWFQVENFKPNISYASWQERELRVEKNTRLLLDLFDSVPAQPGGIPIRQTKVRGTFFILAWLARRMPHLVREIHDRGHEVGSHGKNHNLCRKQPLPELREDLSDSRKMLEDIIGEAVVGFRAPSFSINETVLQEIFRCGYRYDSSYNSFGMNPRYGKIKFSDAEKMRGLIRIREHCHELPISNLTWAGRVWPWGGGGYFRLIPSSTFNRGVKKIICREGVYVFYCHPWEFDPGQPRVVNAPWLLRFRHYHNLSRAKSKLARMIRTFSECRFISCRQYVEENGSPFFK